MKDEHHSHRTSRRAGIDPTLNRERTGLPGNHCDFIGALLQELRNQLHRGTLGPRSVGSTVHKLRRPTTSEHRETRAQNRIAARTSDFVQRIRVRDRGIFACNSGAESLQ